MTPAQEEHYRAAAARYEELAAIRRFSYGERRRFRAQARECLLRIELDDTSPRNRDSVSPQYHFRCYQGLDVTP